MTCLSTTCTTPTTNASMAATTTTHTSHTSTSNPTPPTAEPVWSARLKPVTILPFTEVVGPTFLVPDSIVDLLHHFLTDAFLDDVVRQSNLYAEQVMGPDRYNEWQKITVEELRAFLGFAILMGMVHLPAVEDYWKLDPFLHYAPIADRISRNRFREISRYLHFVDNTTLPSRGQDGYNRLGKVRPIISHFEKVFLESYQPHCEQAVDEAMIPFQGRSSLKQYLPKKPVKRGIKVWVRGDSHNGYFSQFEVYTGAGSNTSPVLGLGGSVVKLLTRPLVGKYHHVFMDNFFTSAALFSDLLLDGIYACGTARSNRKGYPEEFKGKHRGLKKR